MPEGRDYHGFRTFAAIKFDGGPLHGREIRAGENEAFALGARLCHPDAPDGIYLVDEPIGEPWGPEFAWAHWEAEGTDPREDRA